MKGKNIPDAGIENGDLLIFQRQISAKDGDIALMIINNAITIKRYTKCKKILNSNVDTNNLYENVNIVGIIVGLIRNNF